MKFFFSNGLLVYVNGREKLGGGGEAPEGREPTLQDAQTEEGRKRIIKSTEDFVAKLEKQADRGDSDAETRAGQLRDLMEKYRLEGFDPIHDFSPDSKAKALTNHAKELFNSMNVIKKDLEKEKRRHPGVPIAPPDWLRNEVLKAPVKEFKAAFDESLKRLNGFRDNPYTNMIVDRSRAGRQRNPNINELYTKLAQLDEAVRGAKNSDEVKRATREVASIADPKAVEEAMKADWAFMLVSSEVNKIIENNRNIDPKNLLKQVRERVSKLSENEPLKSQPDNAVYIMEHKGIQLSVAKMAGNKYAASIDGINEYYENQHPKIARYVHEREERETKRA